MEVLSSFKVVPISLFLYLHLILHSNSASCNSLNTSESCGIDNRCSWDNTSNACYCANQAPIDVIFFMDESGSMSSTEYIQEKQFVVDMINQGLSQESHAHVFRFGSAPRQVWGFWQVQWPRDLMESAILNAPKSSGGTNMNAALQTVDDTFALWQTQSEYEGFDRLLVFLTDGQASGSNSPCLAISEVQSVVGAENIVVVGMGNGWSASNIECMVTPGYPNGTADYSRILEVDVFTPEAFNAAFEAIGDFLCPSSFSLKLTEVRMEPYAYIPVGGSHHSRYVEFYNDGILLDLATETVVFEGLLSSNAYGKIGNASCNRSIPQGSYVVFYDPDVDVPTCTECNCALNTNQQCTDAVYIPCNSDSATDCGICIWDTDPATASNNGWTQTVKDYASTTTLSTATREGENATGWPIVNAGFSSELRSVRFQPEEPTNWDMSCHWWGTPGAPPLSPCYTTFNPTIDPTNVPTDAPTDGPTRDPVATFKKDSSDSSDESDSNADSSENSDSMNDKKKKKKTKQKKLKKKNSSSNSDAIESDSSDERSSVSFMNGAEMDEQNQHITNDLQMLTINVYGLIGIIILCNIGWCCFCFRQRRKKEDEPELEESYVVDPKTVDIGTV